MENFLIWLPSGRRGGLSPLRVVLCFYSEHVLLNVCTIRLYVFICISNYTVRLSKNFHKLFKKKTFINAIR